MNSPHEFQRVRQVHLPGGKVIEVITFERVDPAVAAAHSATAPPAAAASAAGSQDEAASAPPRPAAATVDLHMCPRCRGDLVYPVDWAEAGRSDWQVELRCPDCEWRHTGVFDQEAVERFDLELDRGADALLRDLQSLTHANMADDVDRFCRALELDLIQPSDFS